VAGACFYSLEMLHCLRPDHNFNVTQVSGAVCMFGFLVVSNVGTKLFYEAWTKQFGAVCHDYESYNIVSELFDHTVPFNVKTELFTLQQLMTWYELPQHPDVRVPETLLHICAYDVQRAHAIYAVLVVKAMHLESKAPNQLVRDVMNNWNLSIFDRVVSVGMNV